MLSPRPPAEDPSPRSSQTPVQGRNLDCTPTTPPSRPIVDTRSPDSTSASAPAPVLSPTKTIRQRDQQLNVDTGSPTRHQSPLRQALSYTDSPQYTTQSPIAYRRPNMSFTGDRRAPPATASQGDSPQPRMPGWFTRGNSSATEVSRDAQPMSDSTTSQKLSPATNQKTSKNPTPTASSRFAFFSSSVSALKGLASSPVAIPQDDELMYLDIETALFPPGSAADKDAFSPAAFMNLQMTATGLLTKYQNAYQQRTIAFQELKAEREAQIEEKDEAETRVQHLKMQLEGMARKASEQEAVMLAMMEELNREKKLRQEDRLAREKGLPPSEGSTVSEDLGAEDDQRRRTWRKSGGTAKSDFSVDTDEESIEEASVFSRSRSPTIATTVSDVSTMEAPGLATPPKPATLGPPRVTPRPSQPQMTTFQRLFKGTSPTEVNKDDDSRGPDGCRNCQGQDAGVAWDTVSLLRYENRGLKERVGGLEDAVEGALDVVNGIGL